MRGIRRAFWYCGTAPPSALCRFDFSSFDKYTNSPREKQKCKIQDFDYVTKETHLRGLRGSPKASPRRCVKIEDFVKYIWNTNVDFSEIDSRGGARDWKSRRPTPPRAFQSSNIKDKEKLAKHALRRVNFESWILNFELKLLTLWFDTIVNRQQN